MDKRFECIHEESFNYEKDLNILKDTKTGVLYVAINNVGLTVMVDKDGKPLTK